MSAYDLIIEAAADERGKAIDQRHKRPTQRRCAEEAGSRPLVTVRAKRMELRDAGDETGSGTGLHFRGFASVYNYGYEMWDVFGPYTEQVMSGAGANSLARDDLDVPFVLQHQALRRIARTTNDTLSLDEREEDGTEGLHVDAPSLDRSDQDVAYIEPKIRSGLIDEMSFRFMIVSGSWSPDWMEYHIEEYDIHRGDVSIVGYGANPGTAGAGFRGSLKDMSEAQLRQLERELTALRRDRRGSSSMSLAALQGADRALEFEPV